jgi:hypothetical protein
MWGRKDLFWLMVGCLHCLWACGKAGGTSWQRCGGAGLLTSWQPGSRARAGTWERAACLFCSICAPYLLDGATLFRACLPSYLITSGYILHSHTHWGELYWLPRHLSIQSNWRSRLTIRAYVNSCIPCCLGTDDKEKSLHMSSTDTLIF